MGAPLYGEPIPVAWGDGGAQSEWRPAEIGAAVYDAMGVCVCVCVPVPVCVPEEWFSLWLILHAHLAALEGGAPERRGGQSLRWASVPESCKGDGEGRGEVLASVLHRPVKKKPTKQG